MCPDALAALDQIGFGAYLDSLDLPKIRHLDFEITSGSRIAGPFPMYLGRDWGYAIRRELLDRLLLSYVLTRFPEIRFERGFRATGLGWEDGAVTALKGRNHRGLEEWLPAELVIGADGRSSTVARAAGAARYDVRPIRTSFYYAYFSGVEPASAQPSLVTYIGHRPFSSHLFSQDAEDGLTGVGVQASERHFAAFKNDPEGLLWSCIEGVAQLQRRFSHARRETKVKGILVPEMYKRACFGAGWALVGDAALHFNPITGQGLNFATMGAVYLADAIRAWRDGVRFEEALGNYQALRDAVCFHHYERAASSADLDADMEPWRQKWYAWMATRPDLVAEWLKLLSNAIPPDEFFSEQRLQQARKRFA